MMMLLMLAAVIGFPVLAFQGKAYRGLYGGGAAVFLLLAFLTYSMIATPLPADASEETIRGTEAINSAGPNVFLVMMASAVGCVIGALIYRPRQHEAPTQ